MELRTIAIELREKIARLDSMISNDDFLREVVSEVQAIKTASLVVEELDDDLETEISGWIDRFCKSPQTMRPADILFLEPGAADFKARDNGGSLTRTFDYDTSDPRTQDPTFVKNSPNKRRTAPNKSYPIGSDEKALIFAQELNALRAEVLGKGHIPRSPTSEEILLRVLALYKACSTRIHWKYQARVRRELDTFALQVSGENIKRNLERSRSKELYREVPAEVGPIFGGHIVSGGLPTMGRGRR